MQALRAPALVLALMIATSSASAESPRQEVERLAREAAERIVAALSVILTAIPQYELPEILPNGDIIVRRKNLRPAPDQETPPRRPPNEPPAEGDQTDT